MEEDMLIPDAAPGVHEKVLSLVGEERQGKVLDAPSGEGNLSAKLKELGYEVWAADLNDKTFKVKDVNFDKVDLNGSLPYDDNSFGHIVCVEGIEHLENPHNLIREFRRVLSSRGSLILTTPNTLNVYSRLRYFFFGSPDRLHSEIEEFKGSLYEELRRHINPVGLPEIKYILENNGFKIRKITTNESVLYYRGGNRFLKLILPVVFLLLGGIIRLIAGNFRKKDSLFGVLLTPEVLFGDTLILKAVKE